jgi:hypothetical protein
MWSCSWVWFAATAGCWCSGDCSWWSALLLLEWFLAACPSPPRVVPGCLPFFPWLGSWASDFQESIHGCFCWMVWWWYAENYDVLLSTLVWPNGWCFPWPCSSLQLLVQLITVVVTTPHSVSVTELLVSCLHVCLTQLRSDPLPGRVVMVGLIHKWHVPRFWTEQILCLIQINSVMQMAKYIAKVWE